MRGKKSEELERDRVKARSPAVPSGPRTPAHAMAGSVPLVPPPTALAAPSHSYHRRPPRPPAAPSTAAQRQRPVVPAVHTGSAPSHGLRSEEGIPSGGGDPVIIPSTVQSAAKAPGRLGRVPGRSPGGSTPPPPPLPTPSRRRIQRFHYPSLHRHPPCPADRTPSMRAVTRRRPRRPAAGPARPPPASSCRTGRRGHARQDTPSDLK